MEKLKMIKMGMNIYKNSDLEGVTDLSNFRYYINDLELKDGKICRVVEVTRGARYTEQSLKKGKSYDNLGCWFHTYYYDENNNCIGLLDIDNKLNKGNYTLDNIYDKQTILKLINSISKIKFDDIEEISR